MVPNSQMQAVLNMLAEAKRLPDASELALTTVSYAVLLEPMVTYLKLIDGVEIVKDGNGTVVEIKHTHARLTSEGKQVYEIAQLSDCSRIIL